MKNAKVLNRMGLTVLLLALFVFSELNISPVLSKTGQLWTTKTETVKSSEVIIGGDLFSRLAEQLSPAVVNIRSLQKVTPRYYGNYPYGVPRGPDQKSQGDFQERGEGSGFIINKEGYILTNAHVVLGSDAVQVALSDGKLFRGKPVGIDPIGDIALIKIDAGYDLPVLPLGSSDKLKIGEWVMAIGSPFGLELTVTAGIVSGKGRSLGMSPFDDFIQTDAPINPGNSGGPLINTRGEVVGINSATLPQGQGLGFSLPIDLVKKLLPQLLEKGRVDRSWLGVTVQDITLAVKEALGLTVDQGSLVTEVVAGSPAYRAGVKANDVIVEFDGQPIKSSRKLPNLIAHTPSGKKVAVVLIRKGKKMTLKVGLEEIPDLRER
jgi:serine protease Do